MYWDNSNIFITAKTLAAEWEGEDARFRIRLHFKNLMKLALVGRPVQCIIAAGSVPPELKKMWFKMMEQTGAS